MSAFYRVLSTDMQVIVHANWRSKSFEHLVLLEAWMLYDYIFLFMYFIGNSKIYFIDFLFLKYV
jgi:hypothetical protein